MIDIKAQIQSALNAFSMGNFLQNAKSLLNILGYESERTIQLSPNTFEGLSEYFDASKVDEKKAMKDDWQSIDIIFQITQDNIRKTQSLFQLKQVDNKIIESYLFFALSLKGGTYNRSDLVRITREINKLTPMPSMILFRYNNYLTIAVIDRRLHKRETSKDVLEKVTLIKDINIQKPHRAHIEILYDLSLQKLIEKYSVGNFVELHNSWQKTLDTSELNKKFYRELANWYFWAVDNVEFPDDEVKDRSIRNATNLIRLITRIIFIWFIKEKDLVPENLFNKNYLNNILNDFNKNNKSHSYYQAILQNLFFGTLNQKMGERGFVREGSFHENKNEYGVKNLFRYADRFTIKEKEVIELFIDIPFLNGGLFDCLDKPNDEGRIIYADGFTRNARKQAAAPDFLFFGDEQDIDLNKIFGTKNKKYKVQGLINLLESYKFTVAENTPIEEEIALDPELLGKVFENLLASYNPETQTTARKQTGSFYTPREIVNYMVDESLIAYLSSKLPSPLAGEPACSADRGKGEGDSEFRLRHLISYTDEPHQFAQSEVDALINAIDNAKILDPACGSGAFPMGILHKLVHILHKLDPKNEQWKKRQIEKAKLIDDPNIRQNAINDIEAAFESNELDYGRKLYLIENSIYGVDIQSIAVQIAKLRFFISLIIDEKKQPGRENLGIRSLPNLETKFVAANTLIGLDKPQGQQSFRNPEIERLEKELKQLRHEYFNAKTRKEKLQCQKQDKKLRQDIAGLLVKDGWNDTTAKQIVKFDPYDQNASADFFDPEWMFGIKNPSPIAGEPAYSADRGKGEGGFDVVIGNPPYINVSNLRPDSYRIYLRSKYRSAKNKTDTYAFFLEEGFNLLSSKGFLSYIIPQTWKATDSFSKLREIMFNEKSLLKIVDLDLGTFSAIVKPMVVLVSNEKHKYGKIEIYNEEIEKVGEISLKEILQESSLSLHTNVNQQQKAVFKKIESNSIKLENVIQFSRGIKTSDDKRFIHWQPKNSDYKKVFRGKNIKAYQLNWEGEYIWYRPDLMKEKVGSVSYSKDFFEVPEKLIIQRVNSSMQLLCAYDDRQNYCLDTTNVSRYKDWDKKTSLKYLCALLNSSVINYWYCNKYLMPTIGIYELHTIPIKIAENQLPFIRLVEQILAAKKKDPNTDTSALERQIDKMVYELYGLTPEEIEIVEGRN